MKKALCTIKLVSVLTGKGREGDRIRGFMLFALYLCFLPSFFELLFCLHVKCKNYETVGTAASNMSCSGDFLLVFKMSLLFSKRAAYVFKFGFREYTEYFKFVYTFVSRLF